MATPAAIFDQTSYRAVYLHNAHRPLEILEILQDHYDQTSVDELMDEGNVSRLGPLIYPKAPHHEPGDPSVSVFYGRDFERSGEGATEIDPGPVMSPAEEFDAVIEEVRATWISAYYLFWWDGEEWTIHRLQS